MQRPTWIAELRVVLVHPDGQRVTGHIAVGQPYALAGADPASSFESKCPVEIDSFYSWKHAPSGSGTLDALLKGVQLLGMMLHEFVSRGGRVLDAEDGSDVDVAAMFGPMWRAAGAPDSV